MKRILLALSVATLWLTCVPGIDGALCRKDAECPTGQYCVGTACVIGERPDAGADAGAQGGGSATGGGANGGGATAGGSAVGGGSSVGGGSAVGGGTANGGGSTTGGGSATGGGTANGGGSTAGGGSAAGGGSGTDGGLKLPGDTCSQTAECAQGICTPFYFDSDDDDFGAKNGALISVCAQNSTNPPPRYSMVNTDCCDTDIDAKPGQTGYFSRATSCGGYDFNCDMQETMQYPNGGCTPRPPMDGGCPPANCDTSPGWAAPVPPCGGSADFFETACGTMPPPPQCTTVTIMCSPGTAVKAMRAQTCR